MRWTFKREKNIYDYARIQRQKLLADEQKTVNQIIRYYGAAEKQIVIELNRTLKKLQIAEDAGDDISPAWWFQQARLGALLATVHEQMAIYGKNTQAVVKAAQERHVAQATEWTAELMDAAGVRSGFVFLHKEALADLIGYMSDGSPLHSIFKEFGSAAVSDVRKAFASGMAMGKNPRVIAKHLRAAVPDALRPSRNRALLIARTETMRSYRSATIRNYANNPRLVSAWRWLSGRDGRCCPICIAMDGSTHQLDEPFASHPGCFVGETPILSGQVYATSRRWYDGQVIKIKVASGQEFTCTPNHPILTPKGWVAAGLLNEGGNVVSCIDAKALFGSVDPNVDDIPATIQQIFELTYVAPAVSIATVPITAEDFHGDGLGGKVDIVSVGGELWNSDNTDRKKQRRHSGFVARIMGSLLLLRGRVDDSFSISGDPTGSGDVSGLGIAPVFFRGTCSHHQGVGVRVAATFNAVLDQITGNDVAGHAERFSDSVLAGTAKISGHNGLAVEGVDSGASPSCAASSLNYAVNDFVGDTVTAGNLLSRGTPVVQFENIVSVSREQFCGHVYNLHTDTNCYAANGIIAHNCRCTAVPVLINLDTDIGDGETWLEGQDEDVQLSIMRGSKRRLQLWQDGDVTLGDMVQDTMSPKWGPGKRLKSLAELTQ